jgi:sigma-E factor negative regulatory protein RseA
MKDQISALLDGELDQAEAGRLIARLKAGGELRRTWDEYHRIGDALRGHFAPDVSVRVCARLAEEPTVLAPARAGRLESGSAQALRRWVLPAAASGAAVALVAWMAIPGLAPAPQLAQQGAAPYVAPTAAVPALVAAPQVAIGALPPSPPPTAESGSALGVGNYLLAHQRFSPANALQGGAPYVRTVSSEGGQR